MIKSTDGHSNGQGEELSALDLLLRLDVQAYRHLVRLVETLRPAIVPNSMRNAKRLVVMFEILV